MALGPDIRRGVSDLDGTGEVVSGIVVMRQGENALDVIRRVKAKLKEIEPGLPPGVKVVPIYDRSELIQRSIDNLKSTLIEIIVTVALVILLFLWHIPSAIIPIITIPFAVLISFIPFRLMGLTANIMSLGGIAIAMGALVDAAIVVVEQTHKKLEEWNRSDKSEDYRSVIIRAVKEVGGPSFFALLVIAVSFLPVLTLEAQEGRLFKPLAYTKTLAMVVAAILAITLDPALRLLFTRLHPVRFPPPLAVPDRQHRPGGDHPPRGEAPGQPGPDPAVRARGAMGAQLEVGGDRRMPAPWCWSRFRSTCGWAPSSCRRWTRGRCSTCPPPCRASPSARPRSCSRSPTGSSSSSPRWTGSWARRAGPRRPPTPRPSRCWRRSSPSSPSPSGGRWTPGTRRGRRSGPRRSSGTSRRTTSPPRSWSSRLNAALQIPGVSNAWTMPIKARIDMLTTGVRTPVGLKISGADLKAIEEIGAQIEALLPQVPGTRSVFAERTGAGFFLDIEWNREALARYGLSIDEAQAAVANAIGGENVTTTIEGRERYPVNVRYMRDFRSDFGALGRVLVSASGGQRQIPLAQLATIKAASGPSMIRNEDGLLTGYVYVDLAGRDPDSYIQEADRLLREKVKLLPGYAVAWSGQYEAMQRVKSRLEVVIPLTLLLIFLLLYMNTRSVTKTCIVALAVPFSAVGAIWFLYLLGYNMSIGVWVGLIALLGVDAETGVFMLLYLDLAYEKAKREGRLRNLAELQAGDPGGRGQAAAAQVHDGGHDVPGPHPDHVGRRDGLRRHEADRRAADRRHLHFVRAGVGGVPADLPDLEVARGEETDRLRRVIGQ